jgi:hypothetical protein
MKITDIVAYPVWVGFRNQFVVVVKTDEGIVGVGEGGLSGRELAVKGAVEHYREFLIGRDPMQRGALWARDVSQPVFRGRARASRRPSRPLTSRSTISAARRWVCPCISFWAASSATACPALPPWAAPAMEEWAR